MVEASRLGSLRSLAAGWRRRIATTHHKGQSLFSFMMFLCFKLIYAIDPWANMGFVLKILKFRIFTHDENPNSGIRA